jgi:hypothetical protein
MAKISKKSEKITFWRNILYERVFSAQGEMSVDSPYAA